MPACGRVSVFGAGLVSTGAQRTLRALLVMIGLAGFGLLSACGQQSTSSAAAAFMPVSTPAAALSVPTTPTATPEPELPPVTAAAGEPIDPNVATTATWGLFDVCSLFDGERLSQVLGDFWSLDDGRGSDKKCLWRSTSDSDESSAVVSIELAFTADSDDAGSDIESGQGAGLLITVDGNELIVNVVSDDVDPTFGTINNSEAEKRIVDDLFLRLTGEPRPEADVLPEAPTAEVTAAS